MLAALRDMASEFLEMMRDASRSRKFNVPGWFDGDFTDSDPFFQKYCKSVNATEVDSLFNVFDYGNSVKKFNSTNVRTTGIINWDSRKPCTPHMFRNLYQSNFRSYSQSESNFK